MFIMKFCAIMVIAAIHGIGLSSIVFGQAAFTSIKVENRSSTNPSGTIFIGDDIAYTLIYNPNGHILKAANWYYRFENCGGIVCSAPTAWNHWGPSVLGVSRTTHEMLCGTQTLKAVMTFQPYYPGGQPTYDLEKIITINVMPPNQMALPTAPSPLNVNVAPVMTGGAPNHLVKFFVQGDGRTLGHQGSVSERLVHQSGHANPFNYNDHQFADPAPGLSFPQPGTIYDWKAMYSSTGSLVPFPAMALDEFDQTLRVTYPKGCCISDSVDFTFHVKESKAVSDHWYLELVP